MNIINLPALLQDKFSSKEFYIAVLNKNEFIIRSM